MVNKISKSKKFALRQLPTEELKEIVARYKDRVALAMSEGLWGIATLPCPSMDYIESILKQRSKKENKP
jgi:hypothetical protein